MVSMKVFLQARSRHNERIEDWIRIDRGISGEMGVKAESLCCSLAVCTRLK